MASVVKILFQSFLLVLVYLFSSWFVEVTGIPLPANVFGIILLFTLLCTGVIKEEYLQEAAWFYLKHLVFFFVAVAVALINMGAIFQNYGFVLLFALVVSTFLPFYSVGIMMQKVMKEEE